MEKYPSKCDSRGRVYLKKSIRSRLGEAWMVIESEDKLILEPLKAQEPAAAPSKREEQSILEEPSDPAKPN